MMPSAIPISGDAYKDRGCTLLARVLGADGAAITQADISAIAYSIYHVADKDTDDEAETANSDHASVAVAVASAVYDTLQTAAIWTRDATGYNLRLDVSGETKSPWDEIGDWRVKAVLSPVSGEDFEVRWDVRVR